MQEEIFEKYPIPKAYFKLALPVVFSMVISLVYNMVDTYFIAGTGNTDLVAGVAAWQCKGGWVIIGDFLIGENREFFNIV